MLRHAKGRCVLTGLVFTFAVLLGACDEGLPTESDTPVPAVAFAASENAADVTRQTFTTGERRLPVDAPCVDPSAPLLAIGPWSGWYQITETKNGHWHATQRVDWSGVVLHAQDGRTWTPGPGAHEMFSFNSFAPTGPWAFTRMHNLRARFNSQDGDSDLQVWHTIHIVRDANGVFRVREIVLPFQGECLGSAN